MITGKERSATLLCLHGVGSTIGKLSNPQKLQEKGNGRDETVHFIMNQLKYVLVLLQGDVPLATSALYMHGGENKKKVLMFKRRRAVLLELNAHQT